MTWELTQRRFIRTINSKFLYGRIPLVHAVIFFIQMSIVARLTSRFNAYYEERPLLTMMVTNTVLGGIADTVAQTISSVRQRGLRKASGSGSSIAGSGFSSGTNSRSVSPFGPDGSASASSSSPADEDVLAFDLHEFDRKNGQLDRPREIVLPESKRPPPPAFDFERLTRYMAYGFFMAPIQFKWFGFLERAFPITKTSAFSPAMKRVVFDQLVFAPLGIAWFFTAMTVSEGGGRRDVQTKLRDMFVPTLQANFMIWPAVQIINFRLMPVQFQLPFVSTVGIAWTAYLSLTNAAEDDKLHIPASPSIRLE